MGRMNFWMVMFSVVIGVKAVSSETDHNGKEHDALCDFVKVAVDKWKEVKDRKPDDPLRKALKDTIFGYGSSKEELQTLKTTLPQDYDKVGEEGSSRSNWCGQPLNGDYQNNYPRWSGHSAPHDMVCLCTLGNNTWPLVGSGNDKLCGKNKNSLGGDSEWWSGTNNTNKKDAIGKTWKVTVNPCLSGSSEEKDLKEALKKFTQEIKHKIKEEENHYVLGENGSDYIGSPCNGSPEKGLCVKYFPNSTETKTWWVDLEKAFVKDEEIKTQRAEEEKRRQQEKERKVDEPHAEIITSSETTTQGTEKNRTDTLHEAIRKYNTTSDTPISLPSSWLLRAVFLF